MGQGPKNQLVKGARDKIRYKIPIAIEREKKRERRVEENNGKKERERKK